MRLLGLDLETTGLDTAKDDIVEIAIVLNEWGVDRPLLVESYLVNTDKKIAPEITNINGISNNLVNEFGRDFGWVVQRLEEICSEHKVDYIVAHNGENFDKPFLLRKIGQHNLAPTNLCRTPWIDTRSDVEFPSSIKSRSLIHLAADHDFLNPFPHVAFGDVLTMFKVLARYDIDTIVTRSKSPWLTVKAEVSYEDRQLAKDRRYFWENIGDKHYKKSWVKRVKKCDFDLEKEEAPFKITVLEGATG